MDFKHLSKPAGGRRHKRTGLPNADQVDWYVKATNWQEWLTNDDLILTDVLVPIERLYFGDEYSAHAQAAKYYHKHNQVYPYMDDLDEAARNVLASAVVGVLQTTIQSEPMEF